MARIPGRWGTAKARNDEAPEQASPPVVPSLGNGLAVPIGDTDLPGLLDTLRASEVPAPAENFYIDWAGIRTRIPMLPWAPAELAGTVSMDLPIPDDGYRSEAVEYACLAKALETAEHTFRIIEVGAGWAPWVVMGVVVARRKGLDAFGIAVEADEVRANWAMQHAADNGLTARLLTGDVETILRDLDGIASRVTAEVDMVVVEAAGWHTSTTLQFPVIPDDDMGGAVWTLPGTDVDYRGAHLPHHDVPAVALGALLDALRGSEGPLVDLVHVDVQGVEYELVDACAGDIQEVTRLMSIGTHSRLNEGLLQQFLLSRGWGLLIDDPCTAVFTMTHPTLPGFTVQDGTQLWENPFLRKDFPQGHHPAG